MSVERIFSRAQRRSAGFCIVFLFFLHGIVVAQEVDVTIQGGFLSDSLKIGEETAYYLSARYPSELTVLFPDSTFAFSPFEFLRKNYFPTETTGGLSADSTVYYLTTFEVGRVQYLQLPVFVVRERDSTVMQAQRDSVLITQFVAEVPDTLSVQELPLRMNTAYQKVFYDWNFWLIVIIVTAFVTLLVITWLLFGKRIRKYFLTKRLQKNHATFLESYNHFVRQLHTAFSTPATESALSTWKKYMEQLESRPYTKLTTRETLKLIKEPVVTEHLSQIDRAIYGHDTSVVDSLENLKTFADQQFKRKLKEVQHG
jgi:hypothetical protein